MEGQVCSTSMVSHFAELEDSCGGAGLGVDPR